jgi:acyl-CoA thioester hydrolase
VTELLRHRLTVRFNDCDPLGHVNNAIYLTYLEQARFTLWRAQLGFVAKAAADGGPRGAGFILARAEIDFLAQARYGDELEVRLTLAGFGRTSFTYAYEIVDVASDKPVARARTVLVRFDYDRQQSVPLTDEVKAALSRPVAAESQPAS